MNNNRREFFRVSFKGDFEGEILLSQIHTAPIKIDNISVGGMSFLSTMEFSMYKRIDCKFTILEQEFLLNAQVVRKNKLRGQIEYAVVFDIDLKTASQLFMQLNYYEIRKIRGRK